MRKLERETRNPKLEIWKPKLALLLWNLGLGVENLKRDKHGVSGLEIHISRPFSCAAEPIVIK
jgi:hypothetical protein